MVSQVEAGNGQTVIDYRAKLYNKIKEVLAYPGNSVYVVKGEHEYMIPAVKQFVLSIDIDAEIMHVRLIEGMRTDED